jgi:hypothetical protein
VCARLIRTAGKPGGTWSRMHKHPAASRITVEIDRLTVAYAIVAIGDEAVPRHRAAQQLDRGLLHWRRQRGEARGMRHPRDRAALGQIAGLLDPAPEFEAAPRQPGIEMRVQFDINPRILPKRARA